MVWSGKNIAAWLLIACGALATGCNQQAPAQPQAPGTPKPVEVVVEQPTSDEITDYEDFTGRTIGTRTIDIRARVTGYLENINFRDHEGGTVQKGEVLFEIDARPYKTELARAEANLLQSKAHLDRRELDLARAEKLIKGNTVSREQYDLAAGDYAEAKAALEYAKANVQTAKLNLSFCKVVAPINGRVSRTQIDAGNVVKADETLLTTIVAIDPIYVYFEVDERTLLRIRRMEEQASVPGGKNQGVPVLMGLADEGDDYPHRGVITFLDNRLDPGTGTLQIRGLFKNPDMILSPGLFVRVRLPIGEPYHALLVAEEALGTDQDQKFVYVVDAENKAQHRRVQVGRLQAGRRVVLKGLGPQDRVVVSGLQRVRPGATVQAKMAPAPPPPSAGKEPSEVAEAGSAETERSPK